MYHRYQNWYYVPHRYPFDRRKLLRLRWVVWFKMHVWKLEFYGYGGLGWSNGPQDEQRCDSKSKSSLELARSRLLNHSPQLQADPRRFHAAPWRYSSSWAITVHKYRWYCRSRQRADKHFGVRWWQDVQSFFLRSCRSSQCFAQITVIKAGSGIGQIVHGWSAVSCWDL